MPRPEIDILAYKASENLVIWVECKSYLDSPGVNYKSFIDMDHVGAQRYKVFNWHEYRETVTETLVSQLESLGLVCPNPTVAYALAAGRIYSDYDREMLHEYFEQHHWLLFDEAWIDEKMRLLATLGYEDDIAIIVAKLFSGRGYRTKRKT